jgi:hypothetical protein
MKIPGWLFLGTALSMGLSPALVGCAKRMPVETGTFEAQQNVVLTFSNDRSLSGKIDTGSRVRYVDRGTIYRAKVKSLSEDSIVLDDLILIRTKGSVEEVVSRLSDSQVILTDPLPDVSLSRSEIQKVELLVFDARSTFQTLSFWSLSGVVLGLLLGERS